MVNVEHLRSASEEELMRLHNEEMKNRSAHYNVFLDELTRRETVRQGKRIARSCFASTARMPRNYANGPT